MAVFGHSGSHAPQLMHSDVIIVAMTARDTAGRPEGQNDGRAMALDIAMR